MAILSENDSHIENPELDVQHVSGEKSRQVPSPVPLNGSRAGPCRPNADTELQCDERLPACHNCTRRNLNCSFTEPSLVPKTVSEYKNDSGWISGLSPKSLPELAEGLSGDPRCFSAVCTGPFPAFNEEIEEVEVVETHGILTRTAALNMSAADRELLLHFETFTSWNLALTDTQWHTKVLNFAFQVCLHICSVDGFR
jgi:Fungal Zn(2)-Cys(6) binuclear cluster domain